MERLTIPDVRVDEHTTRRAVIDGTAVREHAMEIYWRLKAYEDTGMTQERLRELDAADKDGRVLVLPCKVGDTVWVTDARVIGRWMPEQLSQPDAAVILRTYIDKDGKYLFETERYTFERGIIGKAVFLTREEAERAMEGQKND